MIDKIICPKCGHEYEVVDGYVKVHSWLVAPKYLSTTTKKMKCVRSPCYAFIDIPERFREAAKEREDSMRGD